MVLNLFLIRHQHNSILLVLIMAWTVQHKFCTPRRQAAAGPHSFFQLGRTEFALRKLPMAILRAIRRGRLPAA